MFRAQTVHRAHHRPDEVQGCMLLSIKTGGCPEDCAYCPQSAHYKTDVDAHRAGVARRGDRRRRRARREQGATRFCMGAAWRDAPKGAAVRQRARHGARRARPRHGGLLHARHATQEQADALADAGLTAYNHNLDTSPEFYGSIITTRTYDDRLDTLARVREAGHHRLLRRHHRHGRGPHASATGCCSSWRRSIRIRRACRSTCWCASTGTPLADVPPEDPLELVRTIATARILMPASFVRLSAGRLSLTDEAQALCFLAGANSVFLGDRLLTTPNPGTTHDEQLSIGWACG